MKPNRYLIAAAVLSAMALLAQQPGPTEIQVLEKKVAELDARLKIVEKNQKFRIEPAEMEPVTKKK